MNENIRFVVANLNPHIVYYSVVDREVEEGTKSYRKTSAVLNSIARHYFETIFLDGNMN